MKRHFHCSYREKVHHIIEVSNSPLKQNWRFPIYISNFLIYMLPIFYLFDKITNFWIAQCLSKVDNSISHYQMQYRQCYHYCINALKLSKWFSFYRWCSADCWKCNWWYATFDVWSKSYIHIYIIYYFIYVSVSARVCVRACRYMSWAICNTLCFSQ